MADGLTHYYYLKKGWYLVIPLSVIIPFVLYFISVSNWYLYFVFIPYNFYLCRYYDPDDDQKGLTNNEGRILEDTRRFYMGFVGAVIVSYKFIYAYISGLFGGHRSWFSHGIGIKGFEVVSTGTIGRVLFYNIPLIVILNSLYVMAIQMWGWTTDISLWKSFYMNIWFFPYINSRFISWFIGDTIHLILDTEWAKGRLYEPNKMKNTRRKKR